jgi:tRNA threonylcarbamoyladenosine biosynthesis protein TsaB
MKILALETSGEACSVALTVDGRCWARHVLAANRHTEFVLPLLDEVCAEAGIALTQLDGVAFGAGPGAFTGVRVAASVAHGIALAHGLPLAAISSLAALAQGAWRETGLRWQLAMLDARRNEVYWGVFGCAPGATTVLALADERVTSPETVAAPPSGPWAAVGYGWEAYAGHLAPRLAPDIVLGATHRFPHARDTAVLAETEFAAGRGRAPADALPTYLRAPV